MRVDNGHSGRGKPEQLCRLVAAPIPGRVSASPHLSTWEYSRIVGSWVGSIGLDPGAYGTHSMRRAKSTLICRRTKNPGAAQLPLGRAIGS